ncbi:biotin carboxylase N-terminal domain-containing protein [Frigoribacterium endophyticum]|uniref:ATP-binding protein n=1 Tax=Frigoribacterium endophyticum TaxID=1522176 RepID=UPI00141DC730|nr:acetyl-CoA/propionyl-CoA carboxylase biotin carboxyl carrier protein [Frigoribacterium endophyticum]
MIKLLIAERGEVAVRIARACADLQLPSVAVYTADDAAALHVRAADEAWALEPVDALDAGSAVDAAPAVGAVGGSPGAGTAVGTAVGTPPVGRPDAYRDMQAMLDAAVRSGADAVHPGAGPLSESAEFARRVVAAGLTWVGPDPATMEVLGDKIAARALADSVGAPLVVGTSGPVRRPDQAVAFAQRHGLPIALKAANGGGGLGLRVARRLDEVADLHDSAVREAVAVFGRGECFVEQYLDRPRHVEAQVLGDGEGGVVVVGTRECSVQRRHQKLLAEAPAPFLTDEQLAVVVDVSTAVCGAVSYRGAGTVEFLVSQSGQVSFLEVGTALSVEHAVTELTTGVDLVRQQLLLADGRPFEVAAAPPVLGHALSFRVTAEDPGRGFLPAPAPVARLEFPGGPGVRVDAGVAPGDDVPPGRDSLLMTLSVWGRDRDEALRRSRRALDDLVVDGPATSAPFHRRLLDDPAFAPPGDEAPTVHTRWIETECPWLDGLAVRTPEARATPVVLRTWVEVAGRRVPVVLPAELADVEVVAAMVAAVVGEDDPVDHPDDGGHVTAP